MGQGSIQGELGPYTLLEQIAVGGMAEIYLAKTRGVAGFEKLLCLKIIHPNFADDEHFIEMLIDEAKISVGLNHANIVQIFDLGREGNTYFIAMEYIDGLDLFKVMRRLSEHDHDVPIEIAAYIAHEICTGLDYAHRKRDERGQPLSIIHRDISPQNILLSTSGEVKIVDFGIAKASSRSRKTQAGVIKGKYYYMSPEQAWGDPVDQRTDIFSAGIILYEVLAGQMLYLEEDMHRLLDMVRKADIPRPSTRRTAIPPQLENVVMKALAKRPADRWQTAHEFQVALTNFLFSYAPDFTPSRLADLIEHTMADEIASPPELTPEPLPQEPPRPRGQTRQVDVESLMSRVDFSPRTENSVIFRVSDLIEQRPDPVSVEEEDRGEKTQISGPPAMMHGLFPDAVPGASAGADVEGTWPAAEDDPTMISRNPPLRPQDQDEVTRAQGRRRRRSRQIPAEVVIPRPLVDDPDNVTDVSLSGGADLTPTPLMEITSRPDRSNMTPALKTDPQQHSPGQRARADWSQAPRSVSMPPPVPPPVAAPQHQPTPQHQLPSAQAPHLAAQPAPAPITPSAKAPLHIAQAAAQPVAHQPAQVQYPFQPAPAAQPPQPPWPQPTVAPGPAPNWPPVAAAPLPPTPQPATPQPATPQPAALQPATPQPAALQPAALQPAALQPAALQPATPLSGMPQQQPTGFPHTAPSQAPQATPTMFNEADNMATHRAKRRSRKLVLAGLLAFFGLGLIVAAIFFLLLPGRVDPTLEVISVPKGAQVAFDGKQLLETTPVVIPVTDLEQRHTVKVSLTNYQVWQRKLTFSEDDPRVRVLAVLTPIYGKLDVRSTPKDADVYINGEHRGKTPTTVDNLPPDEDVSIELRKRGYKPATRTLKWSGQTYLNAEITLKPSR